MAKKIKLKYPFEHEGKTISEIEVRRPNAEDMIELGDHMSALMRLADYAETADGKEGDQKAAAMPPLDRSVFEAMTAFVGRLGGIGEAAKKLDAVDLIELGTEVLLPLAEVAPRGPQPTGAVR